MNNVPILQQPSFACPDLLVQGIGSLAGLGLGEHSILSSLSLFDPLTIVYTCTQVFTVILKGLPGRF